MSPRYRILMSEHQQFSILRQVTAERRDGEAERPQKVLERDPGGGVGSGLRCS
jgi:hypothetical protein